MVPIIIDIHTGLVTVPTSTSCYGVEVLDVVGDLILGRKSDPVTPPYLVIARAGADLASLAFSPVGKVPECPVPGLIWTSQHFHPANIFTAHYVGPRWGGSRPDVSSSSQLLQVRV